MLSVLLLSLAAFFLFPNPKKKFSDLYHGDNQWVPASLDAFRERPVKSIEVEGQEWKYFSGGSGEQCILFLHGMAGDYDIWWNQILFFQDRRKVISVSYPPVSSLKEMGEAVMKILDEENITKTNLVGTSLGGYLAQYLKTTYPSRIDKIILGNTFPPNDLYEEKNSETSGVARFLPEWLVMTFFRRNVKEKVVPASENSPIVEAFLLEQSYGGMSKEQFLARYHCVVDKFMPSAEARDSDQIFIIESDNDPLIFPELREQLRALYPNADVLTYHNQGHFPYLNQSEDYTSAVDNFLSK